MANNMNPFDDNDFFNPGTQNRGNNRQPQMGFQQGGFQSNYRARPNLDGQLGDNGRDGTTRGWLNIGQNITMPNGEVAFVSINVRGVILDHIDVQGGSSDFTKARNWLRKQLLNGWSSLQDGETGMLNSQWRIQMRRTDPANLQGDGHMSELDDDASPFDEDATVQRQARKGPSALNLASLDNDLSSDEEEILSRMLTELRQRQEHEATTALENNTPKRGRPTKANKAEESTAPSKLSQIKDSF